MGHINHIEESRRTTPILDEVDVLVVGSGPSGLAAAAAAAREGVKTMILERYGCFGGVISQVGVEGFAWYRHEKTIEAGGIARELESRAIDLAGENRELQSDSQALDAQMFKIVADQLVTDAGAIPLLHALAVGAVVEQDKITGVLIEGKSGRLCIKAKRVIDCTGDGDIAAFAGAPYTQRSTLSCVTPIMNCKGVDTKAFRRYIFEELRPTYADWKGEWEMTTCGKEDNLFSPYLVKPFSQAIKDGFISPEEHVDFGGSFSSITEQGEVTQLNIIFISGVDCTDIVSLTEAEIKGRRAALQAMKVLNAYVPGFENARIRDFGMTMGTRESRQVTGHYHMRGEDVTGQARFEDTIGIFPEFIDGNGKLWLPTTGRYYQIPYRALVPQRIDNLLIAGRAISGDIEAHSSFRNMSCCVVTGQGAGVAAAISVKDGVSTSLVDIKRVQRALERQSVRIW